MSEIEGPRGGRGKWSQKGVPHKGWVCINTEDLGGLTGTCEMCDSVSIRYTHYMMHPDYSEMLACGQVCAGHMSEDLLGAEKRDNTMKANAGRRKRFPHRKAWYRNQNGNLQLKDDNLRITIFCRAGKYWKAVVYNYRTDKSYFTRDSFETVEDAQRAAFDTINFVRSLD